MKKYTEIIYYTNNKLDKKIMEIVQAQLLKMNIPIINISLSPMNFGTNIVLNLSPSVITMFKQILTGLNSSTADYVFFTEHDVLYHPSHFDFVPSRDDVYYFNTNVWRWKYPEDYFITYDHLISLSGICANRLLLKRHYEKRLAHIESRGWEDGRDPNWARKIGYEPGKPRRKGGFLDEKTDERKSLFPNIDIRHKRTITPPKVTLDSFRHLPTNWQQTTMNNISGWNLKGLIKA
jgi:hypothetical protein